MSFLSAVPYCFPVALYVKLLRTDCKKTAPTYNKHMFTILARSTDASADSSRIRGAARSMFVNLRPLPNLCLKILCLRFKKTIKKDQTSVRFETVFETQQNYKKNQTSVVFRLF